jgi:ubiquinone/menaquinone biosynthesis C-methylase UbiE
MITRFIAKQLHKPSGVLGRAVLPRLFNKRNAALSDHTFESLALQPDDRVIEVGCGGGYLLSRMAAIITEGLLVGIDVSSEMIAFCGKKYRSLIQDGRLEICCANADDLPYPSNYFTKACSVNTIFYFSNASLAISELWRVLTDGGMLAICFTAKKFLEVREFTKHGLTLYEADKMQCLMESSGFREISMTQGSDRWRDFICIVGKK